MFIAWKLRINRKNGGKDSRKRVNEDLRKGSRKETQTIRFSFVFCSPYFILSLSLSLWLFLFEFYCHFERVKRGKDLNKFNNWSSKRYQFAANFYVINKRMKRHRANQNAIDKHPEERRSTLPTLPFISTLSLSLSLPVSLSIFFTVFLLICQGNK